MRTLPGSGGRSDSLAAVLAVVVAIGAAAAGVAVVVGGGVVIAVVLVGKATGSIVILSGHCVNLPRM